MTNESQRQTTRNITRQILMGELIDIVIPCSLGWLVGTYSGIYRMSFAASKLSDGISSITHFGRIPGAVLSAVNRYRVISAVPDANDTSLQIAMHFLFVRLNVRLNRFPCPASEWSNECKKIIPTKRCRSIVFADNDFVLAANRSSWSIIIFCSCATW